MKDEIFWLATKDGEPCGSFKTREEAVIWLKKLLKQELKDFDMQDRPCEYDYNIVIGKIEIKSFKKRNPFLGM